MLSLKLSAEIENDEDFRAKVALCFNIVAHEVMNESPDTPEHILRANHANHVIQLPRERMEDAASGVVASPAIQNSGAQSLTEIKDQDILEGVRSIWNSMIGLRPV